MKLLKTNDGILITQNEEIIEEINEDNWIDFCEPCRSCHEKDLTLLDAFHGYSLWCNKRTCLNKIDVKVLDVSYLIDVWNRVQSLVPCHVCYDYEKNLVKFGVHIKTLTKSDGISVFELRCANCCDVGAFIEFNVEDVYKDNVTIMDLFENWDEYQLQNTLKNVGKKIILFKDVEFKDYDDLSIRLTHP